MIRITSKQAGFRRCGIAHPAQATDYTDEHFSEADLERLEAEPLLIVERLDGEPEKPGEPLTDAKATAKRERK